MSAQNGMKLTWVAALFGLTLQSVADLVLAGCHFLPSRKDQNHFAWATAVIIAGLCRKQIHPLALRGMNHFFCRCSILS